MGKLLLFAALALGAWFWWRGRSAAMSAAEARALLGVDRAASENDVRAAHRQLIQRVHPDVGGSVELATRINAARDVLLARLGRN